MSSYGPIVAALGDLHDALGVANDLSRDHIDYVVARDAAAKVDAEAMEERDRRATRAFLAGQALCGLSMSDSFNDADWIAHRAVLLADRAMAELYPKKKEP